MKLAFDETQRHIDADGRLHVARSHISKAAVNPYRGDEIPGYSELGLDPNQVYMLLRDPKELEAAAETFKRMPILSRHVPVTVDDPQPDLVIGAVGSDVVFIDPYLDADATFWDAAAIAGIETRTVRELSCAYRYVPVMAPGTYNGRSYDGRMTQIQGNHLAVVEAGRAGPDVVVADHNPFCEALMQMTKLGRAIYSALAFGRPKLAEDAALGAVVGRATRETAKGTRMRNQIMALDSDMDPGQLDSVLDAVLDIEDNPTATTPPPDTATDESPVDKLRALLSGKVDPDVIEAACALMAPPAALDEYPDGEKKDAGMSAPEVTRAMDEMRSRLLADMRAANDARIDVRNTVGDVYGMDSAAGIYGFALDHLKVDHAGISDVTALKALYAVATSRSADPVRMASDSAHLANANAETYTRFPNLSRFQR